MIAAVPPGLTPMPVLPQIEKIRAEAEEADADDADLSKTRSAVMRAEIIGVRPHGYTPNWAVCARSAPVFRGPWVNQPWG